MFETFINRTSGVLFTALLAIFAFFIAQFPLFLKLKISPLILAILMGIIIGHVFLNKFPDTWEYGIKFSQQKLLRLGIILFGFRITFQEIAKIGMRGLIIDSLIVTSTLLLGVFIGRKILKIDRDTCILTTAGSSICGAAAVLATEPVLKSENYKTAVAVGTVVLFGTLSMFTYPLVLNHINMAETFKGIYIGSTVHEVAQVVGAASAVGKVATDTAVIVKLTRVMLLAPFLLILSIVLQKNVKGKTKPKITIPWFVIFFILVSGFNSLHLFNTTTIQVINLIDTLMLTMAMGALGLETNYSKLSSVGIKPLILSLTLFLWLSMGGFLINKALFSLNL